MKKVLSIIVAVALMLGVFPFAAPVSTANAETTYTDGYYTYSIMSGRAIITDVSTSISGDVTIPSTLGGYPVIRIGDDAFWGCSTLTSITIPNSVTSIGDNAFYSCNSLTSITIPDSVTSIGNWAFEFCESLTNITIPDSVTSLGKNAFYYCSSLTSIIISDNVTSIGGWAFAFCSSLKSVTIPNSVTSIGDDAFRGCSSLKSVTIPKGVTSIGREVFYDCSSLKSVTIPNSITSIGDVAFYNCSSLTSITIPNSVKNIGDDAFEGCYGLTAVKYIGTEKDKSTISFGSDNWVLDLATWNYCKHKYSNSCDTTCNYCNAKRTISHTYKTTTTKATTSKNGSISKKCSVCGATTKTTIKYAKTFTLSTTSYTYNGKVKAPSVTVKDSAGKTLKKDVDYTVSYASGRKNVGSYKVTIKMKGNYTGTKTLTFKINPPATTVSKLTAGKKSITVGITKKSTQVTGYQIQCSTSSKFTNATTKTISSYKTTSYTLKSLSAKKTYYVRVRTYKKVGSTTYYSGWSTYKYVKTK